MIKTYEIKAITTLALPLMAAFLAQKGMQLIDAIMMGWIGPYALAAGALATSIFITVLIFCMGVLSSVGVFITHAKGRADDFHVKSSLQHGICMALILALPCMLIIWIAPYLLSSIGEHPEVVKNVKLFLHGLVWGFPGFLLFLVFREYIAGFSLTKVVMLVTAISIPLTFIANYILIYGKLGLPSLGIAGIGYAGAGIMWFMFFCLLVYSRKSPLLKQHLTALSNFKFDPHKIKEMFRMGIPSGFMLTLDMGMFLLAAIMMGYFSVSALAAHQITIQCLSLAYASPFALSMATALQVSYAVGAKNFSQAKHAVIIALSMGLIIAAAIAVIFIIAPELLTKIFLKGNEADYKEIQHFVIKFLAVTALFQCFDALQTIMSGALRGLKDTFVPMLLNIICYWLLGVGGGYYLAFHTHLGAIGIWYGLTLGICSTGIILTIRFIYRSRLYSLSCRSPESGNPS